LDNIIPKEIGNNSNGSKPLAIAKYMNTKDISIMIKDLILIFAKPLLLAKPEIASTKILIASLIVN
jgi:hypothetical protein